jgi:hypothetical protein
MDNRQKATRRSGEALQPLHTLLVTLHPLFELCQPPRLSNPHQLLHLALQHTQIREDLPFELSHRHLPLPKLLQLTGKSVNTALENREYTGGTEPSYIRT